MMVQAWSDTVHTLSALSLRKPKIHRNASEGGGNLCPFYYKDDAVLSADRFHSFHSIGTLSGRVNNAHTSATPSLSPADCSYVECEIMLEQGEHLKNHLATVHSLNL